MDFVSKENLLYVKPLYEKKEHNKNKKYNYDVDGRKYNKTVDNIGYKDYIKSKRWAIKRRITLIRDEYMCVSCNSKKNLNVHHLTYKNLGNEAERDLVTLCRSCHKKEHELDLDKSKKQRIINEINERYLVKS